MRKQIYRKAYSVGKYQNKDTVSRDFVFLWTAEVIFLIDYGFVWLTFQTRVAGVID